MSNYLRDALLQSAQDADIAVTDDMADNAVNIALVYSAGTRYGSVRVTIPASSLTLPREDFIKRNITPMVATMLKKLS